MLTYDNIANRLSYAARICGSSIRDNCPVCQGVGALSLTRFDDGAARLVCHKCRTPMGALIRALGEPAHNAKVIESRKVKPASMRIAEARDIWRSAGPISGTQAESYLRSRGITIPLPPTLRYHRNLKSVEPPFRRYGALVAAMTKADSRELRAVYVIYVQDSAKAPLTRCKIFRGCPAGCSVHLAPVTGDSLTICEGAETGLSIVEMDARYGEQTCVWACGSTSGLINFEVPQGIRTLYVSVDIDPPRQGQAYGDGEIAARTLVDRLNRTLPEIEVWLSWPPWRSGKEKYDFNDSILETD